MAVSVVFKDIIIDSHKGEYSVSFNSKSLQGLANNSGTESFYIIDKNVADLYSSDLESILESEMFLLIDASEDNKSLDKFPYYVEQLVSKGIKRGHTLVAIGGGITQDITCFLASTLMRGLDWIFYPTTLLAQSDSCIGSKSSINSGKIKNILGTFTPPQKVILDINFLETLNKQDIFSGIGEMIKVHAIDSPESFDEISKNYNNLITNSTSMKSFIYNSLLIKKRIIELDEFDKGPRNVMNYGHSFGHAIESATNYAIPHGIAVTIGMDMANFIAMKLKLTGEENFYRMHGVLEKNSSTYRSYPIEAEALINALSKDKKNTATQLRLIMPNEDSKISIGLYDNSSEFRSYAQEYLNLFQR